MNGKKSRALRKKLGFKSDKKTQYKKHNQTGQMISSKNFYRKHKKAYKEE